jgi:uncharacterized protein (TIGR02246 family)
MKQILCTLLFFFSLVFPLPPAQAEPLDGLRAAAERFTTAYNKKDLDEIVTVFAEDVEMVNEIDQSIVRGMDEISAYFEESFREKPDRQMALEVGAVRLISDSAAIEDGVIHFSVAGGENTESIAYTATLVRGEDETWKIAETRQLRVVSEAGRAAILSELDWLVGEWTLKTDDLQMDVWFDWSPGDNFLLGEALTTTDEGERMITEIRIGYDAGRNVIRWWTFDDAGGFGGGDWIREKANQWRVESRGVTADGERTSASQRLNNDGESTVICESRERFLDGEALPDIELRLVKQPPPPSPTSPAARATKTP